MCSTAFEIEPDALRIARNTESVARHFVADHSSSSVSLLSRPSSTRIFHADVDAALAIGQLPRDVLVGRDRLRAVELFDRDERPPDRLRSGGVRTGGLTTGYASAMKIKAMDLRDAVADGVSKVVSNVVLLEDERRSPPHPEYLTTATVGFFVREHFEMKGVNLVIRFEVQTGTLWREGEIRAFLSRQAGRVRQNVLNLRSRIRNLAERGKRGWRKRLAQANRDLRDADRVGNIDIAIYRQGPIPHPFAIVENKGVLRFTDAGAIYVGSRAELDKDIRRNAHYVLKHSEVGGVQFAAFTFYLEDKASVTDQDAVEYNARIHSYFVDHLKRLALDARITTNVLIRSWDSELALDDADACRLDAKGELDHWHIAFGVISLYVTGVDIDE
ncbi:hypothetical protein [Variovorax sp. 770b2]|uniref:hypothetical protein n=1 Tax=Variovorax sp. 770b2 TaxID=1566271 RepID=UPI001160C34D|nr:hypothetical protein [Variovorax sp. 770b2]